MNSPAIGSDLKGDVPVCIGSGNGDVSVEGLRQWHDTNQPVRPPLVNSVKAHAMDSILPLKKDFDFAFVGLLLGEKASAAQADSYSIGDLHELAKRIFDAAVGRYGFKSEEIFFDPMVFPPAIDICSQACRAIPTGRSKP